MMIKRYKQMDEIRGRAERKCRKFTTSAAKFSPVIQDWYDTIHAHMDLLTQTQTRIKQVHEQRQREEKSQEEKH